MADVPNIDPDLQPQSRPRSCTWPMKRPNVGNESDNGHENGVSIKLEPTIEEAGSEEQLMIDEGISPNITLADLNQENDDSLLMSGAFGVGDYHNGLIKSPAANCVTDFTSSLTSPQPLSTVTASDISNNNPSFINLDPAPHSNTVSLCNYGAVTGDDLQNTVDTKPSYHHENITSPGHLQNMRMHSLSTGEEPMPASSPAVTKPKSSSRKNAWGNMSYADLITQGIESSPDKRLTLAQIYDWMVKNVPYFKDKGDSNSSAGWKNSIRHNLSLHAKFKRVQNEGTGKSSWWVINHDAKPGKPNRRRTTSLDASNPKFKQSRAKALGKKSDLPKKQKSSSKKDAPPTWAKSGTPLEVPIDYEHPLNKSLLSDYRPRTSSNASSISGRITPPRSLLTQDLEDDGPPPLSPLSSSSYAAPTNPLDFGRTDPFNLVGDMDPMQTTGELLENINIDMVTSSPMSQSSSETTNIYLNSTQNNKLSCSSPRFIQQLNGVSGSISSHQQQLSTAATTNPNNGVLSSPNLASLLQQGKNNQQAKYQTLNTKTPQNNRLPSVDINNTVPRARANTMPKLQPQPKYNMSDTTLRRQQSGESLMQGPYYPAYRSPESQQLPSPPENTYIRYQYGQNQSTQQRPQVQEGFSSLTNQNKTLFQLLGQPRSDDVTAASQAQQLNINQSNSLTVPEQQQGNCDGSLMLQSYSVPQQNSSNDLTSLGNDPKYPSDLSSIDNQDMFDPGTGTFDIEEMLQDISPGIDRFGSEFNSYFPQGSFEATEADTSMDTTNTLTPTNSNPSMDKLVESTQSSYSYLTNPQINSDAPFASQQRYPQPVNMYSVNEARGPQLLLGNNRPSNGRMLITRSSPSVGITTSGLTSHFAHPHQMLRPQGSVGAVSDYRM